MVEKKNEVVTFKGTTLPSKGLSANFDKALEKASESIETAGGLPFLKMDRKDGEWKYGQNDTYVQEGSEWAINVDTLEKGFISWTGGKSIKKMRNIQQGEVTRDELPMLPPTSGDWTENVSFQLLCMNGEDKGTTVLYETSSYGGRAAWKAFVEALRKQLREDRTRIIPIVGMENSFYMHTEYGKTFNPLFPIKRWVAYDGGDSEPEQPEASPEEKSPKERPPVEAASAKTNGAAPKRRAAAVATDVEDEAEAAKPAPGPAADPVTRRRRRAAAS